MFDKGIKSKRILTPQGIRDGIILIDKEKISDIISYNTDIDERVYDAGSSIVIPGVIDPHVHINEPGRTDWEGFDTATKAAIAGGITTLVDMPLNSSPVTTTVDAFNLKIQAAKDKLHTNCGFWGGVVPGFESEIPGLADAGVLGFKAFLTHSGIDEFPNVTAADLSKAMPLIAKTGLPLLVHCELSDTIERATGDPRSYNNYLSSRPKEWENEAIALMIELCREFNCRVHIVHLSSAEAIGMINDAKASGLPLTVETGQHYLYFNAEDIADGQTQFKCAPPIRERANNELLWDALKSGIIDFVATDHSPCLPSLKEQGSGNFMKAWGGISSIQFALPVLWSAASRKGFSITDVSKWLSENPAKLIGMQDSKGKIQPGYDADLVLFDDENKFEVKADDILHKHKITPYVDEWLRGVVEQTYLGGSIVYDRGVFNLKKGKLLIHN